MAAPTHALVEHFFRHEYGRLVAHLARAIGVARLELVEDVVQTALVRALQSWSLRGVPDDPAGWLYRVARNAATDALRRDRRQSDFGERDLPAESSAPSDDTIADDQLRLLFACCHPTLPLESQVALALKTLCGFSTGEIASGLLTTEANAQKRLARAKERLRESDFDPSFVPPDQLADRLEAVRTVIYLLFNEGYHSTQGDTLIRRDVCDEAIRLGRLLASDAATGDPTTFALLALMLLNAARFEARIAGGGQLLLEDQDRTKWDPTLLAEGFDWFVRSGSGDALSRYHLEAGIVSKHAAATSFATTDWTAIVTLYDLLLRIAPSPIHALNRAVAVAQRDGPAAGITELNKIPAASVPEGYYLWPAVVGELHRRAGHLVAAREQLGRAFRLATSPAERELIQSRLKACAGA
jgi:RNA polymerase sigma factor (sigma-70 family)